MNTKKTLKKTVLVLMVYICLLNTITAQEKILLSQEDMSEFTLKSQDSTFWAITDNSFIWVPEQIWNLKDNGDYYIKYCEFEHEADAIKAIAYEANSNSWPYYIGFVNGSIYGDNSWVGTDGGAVYFQIKNFGIKIFKPVDVNSEDGQTILKIADLIAAKIEENVSPAIILKENELLEYRISDNDYQNIVYSSEALLSNYGYTEDNKINSKWIIPEDSLMLGIRKQWSTSNSYVCIDIASYSDSEDAQSAVNYFSELPFAPIPVCNFDTELSVDSFIDYLTNSWSGWVEGLKLVSIAGVSQKYAVHLYYYNNTGLDTSFYKSLLKSLNFYTNKSSVSNLDGSVFNIFPNPASSSVTIENKDGKTETYNLRLFNALGKELYSKRIELSNSFKLDLGEFSDGIYYLTLQNNKEQHSQKILLNK